MKKISGIAAVLAMVALPALAFAAQINAARDYTLPRGETVATNEYAAGQNVSIIGDVEGDLVAAGGSLLVAGPVGQDLTAAGGSLNLIGDVKGDLRAAGGAVLISGKIDGDLMVAGGIVHLLPEASVSGDVLVAGGRVALDGSVGGSVRALGGNIALNGPVGGDARIIAGKLFIEPHAVIHGNLNYRSREEATVETGAVIRGETSWTKLPLPRRSWAWIFPAFIGVWKLFAFLATLATAFVLLWLFRPLSNALVQRSLTNFSVEAVRGFVILVTVPAAALVIALTLIGIPVSLLGAFAYAILLILGCAYGRIILGAFVEKHILQEANWALSWKTVVIGAVAYLILGFIPFIGWFGELAFFLAALGAIAGVWYRRFWLTRGAKAAS